MKDIRRNVRIMFVIVMIFIFNKFFLRPYILENEFPEFINIFVLSFPIFCEAVIGGLIITNLGLFIKHKYLKENSKVANNFIYIFAVLLTGVYVISQELKIHNLGGNNIYDPFDILFSVIGLITVYLILIYFKPIISTRQ